MCSNWHRTIVKLSRQDRIRSAQAALINVCLPSFIKTETRNAQDNIWLFIGFDQHMWNIIHANNIRSYSNNHSGVGND